MSTTWVPSRENETAPRAAQTVPAPSPPDILCFSHLRWDFVFQRPQHLLSRYARSRRVFFVEEPVLDATRAPWMDLRRAGHGVQVAVPHLGASLGPDAAAHIQRSLLDDLVAEEEIRDCVLWYYTPLALRFSSHLTARAVVYDCMDELSAFKDAPAILVEWESRLLDRADVVFTGGWSLYEAKRRLHPNVHGFPSSVDVEHFARARRRGADPADQAPLARPRIGFFGVIDERMDLALLDGLAAARPGWQVVMLGPVVKVDEASLPRRANIHYLGARPYQELPGYLAGWDVAMLPFARCEATRFVSPTKIPEYLAAGRPVVSTSIRDVVRPYGENGVVRIADSVADFVAAVEAALEQGTSDDRWLARVDRLLSRTSWDRTWAAMASLVEQAAQPGTDDARV
jgi:UDP-galactopyranose mutase